MENEDRIRIKRGKYTFVVKKKRVPADNEVKEPIIKEKEDILNESPRLEYKAKKEKSEEDISLERPKKAKRRIIRIKEKVNKNEEENNSDTQQTDREPPKDEEYDLPSRKTEEKGRVMTTSDVCLPSVEIPKERWIYDESKVVGIIYMLTCKATGLSYIGRTVSHRARKDGYKSSGIRQRLIEHKYEMEHGNKHVLYVAMREYGFESFKEKLLFPCPKDEAGKYEAYCIRKYRTVYPNGYNRSIKETDYQMPAEECLKGPPVYDSVKRHDYEGRMQISSTVMNHYEIIARKKYAEYILHKNKSPEEYVHQFTRHGRPFGFYFIDSNGRKTLLKREFGGVHIPMEVSYQRALDFAKWLKLDPKDRPMC